MSLTKFNEIKCSCGEALNYELINSVNVSQTPEIKQDILWGEFNIVKCDSCFKIFYADVFVLYIDLPQEIIAYIHPEGAKPGRAELEKKMLDDFHAAGGSVDKSPKLDFEPLIFFGMDSFVDFLKNEEEKQDEFDVLECICRENKLGVAKIRKSVARKSGIPPLLPRIRSGKGAEKNIKNEIVAGLNEILNISPGLTTCHNALQQIQNNPSFDLEDKILA